MNKITKHGRNGLLAALVMAVAVTGSLFAQTRGRSKTAEQPKIAAEEMTPDLAGRMYEDIKLKNPGANVSLQDIAGGYVGKTLSEALLKAATGKGLSAGDMCTTARELLAAVAAENTPLCSRIFQDIAQELSCDAVQELLDALGAQGIISGCTWYYNDSGDFAGSCGCGGCECCMLP